ncbi:DUF5819 family protein [Luteipulveratus halotolerans]|uniref:DUF5819 family protein n=1 Tax=Luteipulveratus halotolerans TaxID=1631356 RepID=UPI0012F7C141|nr:DUF5819 family protein [Luteipulveratus halotolerans]
MGTTVAGSATTQRRCGAVVAALVAAHLLMTLVYVARPLPVPGPVRAAVTAYLEPVFTQTWSVFAPDPGTVNTSLRVRARTTDRRVTPWFDVTACDLGSAVRHHPVPTRRYLTTFQLVKHYRGSYADVRAGVPDAADRWARSERAMTAFAGLVARARWGDVAATQVQVVDERTAAYGDRDRPGVRPRTASSNGPWKPSASAKPVEQKAITKIYGTGRCAS